MDPKSVYSLSPIAFPWPTFDSNKPIDVPINVSAINGSPPYVSGNTVLPPALGANHRGLIVVIFCDGHSEKIPEQTLCWRDQDTPIFGVPVPSP